MSFIYSILLHNSVSFAFQYQVIESTVRIGVDFIEYNNPSGKKYDGSCCDATGTLCAADPCDLYFTACLDDRYCKL